MTTQDSNMLVLSYSGASNTGCYADKVARMLAESGQANMICLPKVAINDEKLIENVKTTTKKVIVIDGCSINCTEKILKEKAVTNFTHINITDFGITKGKTPITDDKIDEIINHIKNLK